MPRKSLQWIPFECGALAEALPEWFDTSALRVDLEGKINDYEAVTILPGVDMVEQRRHILDFFARRVMEYSDPSPLLLEGWQDDRIFAQWTRRMPSSSRRELLRLLGGDEGLAGVEAAYGRMFFLEVK